jgi:archaetidylinositol phosphate synthase
LEPSFLWLASTGLLINWFGDSLDGTLARFRRIERPRYGFVLDQNLDALEQLIFAIGVGFSGFVRFELAILTLAAFFLMSILGLVRAVVSNVFALSHAGVGLTEVRVAFLLLNASMYFLPPKPLLIAGFWLNYAELLALFWVAYILIAFPLALVGQLRELTVGDPERTYPEPRDPPFVQTRPPGLSL